MTVDRTGDAERLADMLVRCGIKRGQLGQIDADNVARILMPIVDAIARERTAQALEAAADSVDDWHLSACDPVVVLRNRAAILRGGR
jgi:hypothetical protein